MRRSHPSQPDLLPAWIFDVDESDDMMSNQTILEALEIDLFQIQRTSVYVLTIMWIFLGNRINPSRPGSTLHPMVGEKQQEFWGPFAVVSLFTFLLWVGKVRNVPWIFVIWILFSLFAHFVARVNFNSTLALHISILGYSVLPIIPLSIVIIIFRPAVWLASAMQVFSVAYASVTAYISYIALLNTKSVDSVRCTV